MVRAVTKIELERSGLPETVELRRQELAERLTQNIRNNGGNVLIQYIVGMHVDGIDMLAEIEKGA